jgi:predicted metalloprotease with PDZ domain
MPAPIQPPADVAYPGVIRLSVDATDLDRRIFRVHETVPVAHAGPMTLLYPKWLPGNHGPTGPVDKLAGLVVQAGGRRLEWTRDPVDVFAFHVDVPEGASALDLDFQFLSPTGANEGRVVVTPEMLNLQWNTVALYPAGYFAHGVSFAPSVTLPRGWGYGTALELGATNGDTVDFRPVDLDTLVDSPIFAGRFFRRLDLDPEGPARVWLDIVADKPEQLEIGAPALAAHRALVQQSYRLFGSRHYDHYDFLLGVSDHMSGIGLEHHRSSEDATNANYFTEWEQNFSAHDLLAHEFTHSWNGKFRRAADLWTPNFNVPMRDSLLWVYEGQTQYWGFVLAARSGLWTREQALEAIAFQAATYDNRSGRAWRDLEDTTADPITSMRRSQPWTSWQRGEDYYNEGLLIWLDADTLIRERSGGRRSLDDFARAFFGVRNGSWVTDTYGFEDVVAALNAVEPYDWAAFLKARLTTHGPGAPLDGVGRGGYRLAYAETPTNFFKSNERRRRIVDLTYSLGVVVNRDSGALTSVQWDGPAFRAGLTEGAQIVAVNGVAYDQDELKGAIKAAAKPGAGPISLIVKRGDRYSVLAIDYHGGLRYPRLERTGVGPARLDEILEPKP